jgi:hypothetical protein
VPTFEFRCERCEKTEERFLPMSKAPAVGEKLASAECCGKPLTRIHSVPTLADVQIRVGVAGYPYVSRRHQDLPGCKETPDGHPIIKSPRHEREIMAQTGLVRE